MPPRRVAGAAAPSDAENARAKKEVRGLAFVGLVEQMDASLCRFAKAYLEPHSLDLCAAGAAKQRENVALKARGPDEGDEAAVRRHNKYDIALYEIAVAEFSRREAGT